MPNARQGLSFYSQKGRQVRKRNAIGQIWIFLNEIKVALFCRFKKKTLYALLCRTPFASPDGEQRGGLG